MKERQWVELRDALAAHARILAAEGGASGIRDTGLLQSALARTRQLHAYGDKPDITTMAAAYTFDAVKNHPFVDGNRRTGFVLGIFSLVINGYDFFASEESAAHMVLSLAAGTIDEDGFAAWLRENSKRRPRKK